MRPDVLFAGMLCLIIAGLILAIIPEPQPRKEIYIINRDIVPIFHETVDVDVFFEIIDREVQKRVACSQSACSELYEQQIVLLDEGRFTKIVLADSQKYIVTHGHVEDPDNYIIFYPETLGRLKALLGIMFYNDVNFLKSPMETKTSDAERTSARSTCRK